MSMKEISREVVKALASNNRRLARLDLSRNKIRVIENIEELRHLRQLNLSLNEIQKISGLEGLNGLEEIDLSGN